MKKSKDIIKQMNALGKRKEPFVFLIDFEGESPLIFPYNETDKIKWKTPQYSNFAIQKKARKPNTWITQPVSFEHYNIGFQKIRKHIFNGDTYLLNYTQPTPIETELSLEDIFHFSSARYKIFLKDNFVCFSPEPFVKIVDGEISSYPMKGTMDASIPNAAKLILDDSKELAEHNTIVDLIRNDLSLVAENVRVEKFRYLEKLNTNKRTLLQVSSKIMGKLPENYMEHLGEIIYKMLPAGSISGAPKKKTVEIIKAAEKYKRGYYTGIFGVFDGKNLDSCVLIRYVEKQNAELVYKSGGGVTFMSEAEKEYDEMLKKVYVPIFK